MNILIYPLFSTLLYGVILPAKVLMAIFVVVFHVLEKVGWKAGHPVNRRRSGHWHDFLTGIMNNYHVKSFFRLLFFTGKVKHWLIC